MPGCKSSLYADHDTEKYVKYCREKANLGTHGRACLQARDQSSEVTNEHLLL